MTSSRTNWSVHNCACDPECRANDPQPPNRLYLHTPLGTLLVALRWPDDWSQLWLPGMGYTDWWWPIVWHPR